MDYRRYLKHYGVLGMHWGVRKEEPSSPIKKGSQEHFDKVRKANREILKKAPNANVVDWDLFSKKQSIPKKNLDRNNYQKQN